MNPTCAHCQMRFEREPGFYLGSTYINYGVTTVLMTVGFVGLCFVAGIDKRIVVWPLGAFVILFPLLFFRYSRSLWLGMDCFLDSSSMSDSEPNPVTEPERPESQESERRD